MTNFEAIKVSRGEHIVLQMLEKQYQWIARDKNDALYVYEDKPCKKKSANSWSSEYGYCELSAFEHLFQFIRWEDDEPWLITNIINKCGMKFE